MSDTQQKTPAAATGTGPVAPPTPTPPAEHPGASAPSRMSRMSRISHQLSFRNIAAIYIFVAMFIVFSLWVPDTFLKWDTWRAMLDSQVPTAILALAVVVTLSAGAFDLSVGVLLGFGSIIVSWLLASQGMPIVPAIVVALIAGGLVGLVSGLLVVYAKLDSFIATLGVSSLLVALIAWISDSQQILGLPAGFQKIGTSELWGLTIPVYVLVGVAVLVWYVLEQTPVGRRVYATGGNIEAARLAGVRVSLVTISALVAGGVIAAVAGVLLAANLGTGDPTLGPSYLLPAFSAAFLGSTQFRGGRFNVWGTILAVIVLATGVKGLQLGGAPIWIPDVFNGGALLLAVAMAKYEKTASRSGAFGRLLRRLPRAAA